MSNNDYLEAQLFGGMFGLIISVLLAPLFLFIYVMGLFFRAPLAAIFASIVCGFIVSQLEPPTAFEPSTSV